MFIWNKFMDFAVVVMANISKYTKLLREIRREHLHWISCWQIKFRRSCKCYLRWMPGFYCTSCCKLESILFSFCHLQQMCFFFKSFSYFLLYCGVNFTNLCTRCAFGSLTSVTWFDVLILGSSQFFDSTPTASLQNWSKVT